MKLKVTTTGNTKVFDKTKRKFIRAAQGAVKDATQEALVRGRAQIGAAGFSRRWQTGLRSKYLGKKPGQPARLIFHRMPYFSVFERGATISGKPLLWLPLEENLPKRVRSPKDYGKKMVSATIGGRPMLFSSDDYHKALFIGIRKARIRKRLTLRILFKQIAKKLPEYLKARLAMLKE